MFTDAKEVLAKVFLLQREGLRRTIRSRMDRRLHGRIDPSDVLQDAYLEAHRRQDELAEANMPPSLWVRLLTQQKLVDLHRYHQARVHLLRAVDGAEDRAAVLTSLATAERGLGNHEAAKNALEEARG